MKTKRKAMQICSHPDGIAALADDGTIWWTNGSQGWEQMPELPPIERVDAPAEVRAGRPKQAIMD